MTVVLILLVLIIVALGLHAYIFLGTSKKLPVMKAPALEIGELYILQGNDPFNNTTVKILDIKNNWVQYNYIYNGVPGTTPVTATVERFSNIYERIKDAVDN